MRRLFAKYFRSISLERIIRFFARLLENFIWDLIQGLLIAYILSKIL